MRRIGIVLGVATIGLLVLPACSKPDREPEMPEPIADPATTPEEMQQAPAPEPAPTPGQYPPMGQGQPPPGQQQPGGQGTMGQTPGPSAQQSEPTYPSNITAPVERYRDWASNFDTSKMGPSNEYAMEGITRLVIALRALQSAESGPAAVPQEKIDALAMKAERLENSPKGGRVQTEHAREALMAAIEVMEDIQRRRFPEDTALQAEIVELRRAVMGLDPQKRMLDQKEKVEGVFEESVDPMDTMGRISSP